MSWGKIFSVAFVCFFKLIIGGIPTAAGLNLSFLETFLGATIGGLTGITFFVLLIDKLLRLWRSIFVPKTGKVFSQKRRLIVRAKQKFGLTGIAFLTPFLLSMPLGAFLAVKFYNKKSKILTYMYISVLFWSLIGAWLAGPIKDLKDFVISIF